MAFKTRIFTGSPVDKFALPKACTQTHSKRRQNSPGSISEKSRKSFANVKLRKPESENSKATATVEKSIAAVGAKSVINTVSFEGSLELTVEKLSDLRSGEEEFSSSPSNGNALSIPEGLAPEYVDFTCTQLTEQTDVDPSSVGSVEELPLKVPVHSNFTPINQTEGHQSKNALIWGRSNDKTLLYSYNDCSGDFEKTVKLAGERLCSDDVKAIKERLFYLLSFFK